VHPCAGVVPFVCPALVKHRDRATFIIGGILGI
jgi:hypothetical protein